MTQTNQQGAPEALRTIRRFYRGTDCMAENQAGDWVRYEDHVAALVEAQQPAPSAAVALSDDLRDRLVAISEAVADQDDRAAQAMLREILKAPQPSPTPQADSQPAPIDMVLHCPACGMQHIDAPDDRTPDWKNEPHRSHLCHNPACGYIWRPADVPTNGVAAVKTTGKADSPIAARTPADSVTAPAVIGEPVFAFRRKGLDDFCTCTEERYAELSAKPNLFETRIFYATPQPTQAQAGAVPLTDEQLDAAVDTWFSSAANCFDFRGRMHAAMDAAHGIGIKGGQHGADETGA